MSNNNSITNFTFGAIFNREKILFNDIASINCIESLIYQYKLLIFKNVQLTNSNFVNLSKILGEPEIALLQKFQVKNFPFIRMQSNTEKDAADNIGEYWHSDGAWRKNPSKFTLLYNMYPPDEGGETLFVDMENAYKSLPLNVKQKIQDLEGIYLSREIYLKELEELGIKLSDHESAPLKNIRHKLVRKHPYTKRKSLFLSEGLIDIIYNLDKSISDNLIRYLISFSTSVDKVYKHSWEKNDLLIWDNFSIIHKGISAKKGSKTNKRIIVAR